MMMPSIIERLDMGAYWGEFCGIRNLFSQFNPDYTCFELYNFGSFRHRYIEPLTHHPSATER